MFAVLRAEGRKQSQVGFSPKTEQTDGVLVGFPQSRAWNKDLGAGGFFGRE